MLVVVGAEADAGASMRCARPGAEVVVAGGDRRQRLRPRSPSSAAASITSLLLEGGPTLAGAFVDAGEIDELRALRRPGRCSAAAGPLGRGRGAARIGRRGARADARVETVGEDVLIRARLQGVVSVHRADQDIGTVESVDERRRRRPAADRHRARPPRSRAGDSVAVNGVCLTATAVDGDGFEAEAMNQTLELTRSAPSRPGDRVNLELALRAVRPARRPHRPGHVDGIGEVASVERGRLRPAAAGRASARSCCRYVVERGSIALDGVSLTVAALGEDWVEVSLIPETLERTTLGEAAAGAQARTSSAT